MHKYIEFNPIRFLKDSAKWDSEKAMLQEELNSIVGPKGVSNTPVRSGKIGDSVGNAVLERDYIQLKINRIQTYQEALTYAWNRLTEPHREVLRLFFFMDGYKPPLIHSYGLKYALCRSDVYKARREALAELSHIITQKYRL